MELKYVLAQGVSVCTDRDRGPLLMYELAVFPPVNAFSTCYAVSSLKVEEEVYNPNKDNGTNVNTHIPIANRLSKPDII